MTDEQAGQHWSLCGACGHEHYEKGYGPACPICDCDENEKQAGQDATGEWRVESVPDEYSADEPVCYSVARVGDAANVFWFRSIDDAEKLATHLNAFTHELAEARRERVYRGRDGEDVTADEKIEQLMQFGAAMERLAVENNRRAEAAEAELTALKEARTDEQAGPRKLPTTHSYTDPVEVYEQTTIGATVEQDAADEWHRYIDDYSECYEVTNTSRERADIGDGYLFKMGDKDDADRLVVLLNALTHKLRKFEPSPENVIGKFNGNYWARLSFEPEDYPVR